MFVYPTEILPMTFDTLKLEWCGYPAVKKIKNIFTRFDKHDGRIDRRTRRDIIGNAYA